MDYYISKIKSIWFSDDDIEFLALVRWMSFVLIIFHHEFYNIDVYVGYLIFLTVCLFPKLTSYWWAWLILVGFQSIDMWETWIGKANHGWVMWYWGIAILSSFVVSGPRKQLNIIQNNCRWLLIIVMLVAVVWKVINPIYMNGTFFERNLIANTNMFEFTNTVTDMTWEDLKSNEQQRRNQFKQPVETTSYLISSDWTRMLAIFTTWWVLLIELVIGVLLLLYSKRWDWWAHVLHLQFIVFAYAAIPIIGFGWTLLVMGYTLTQGFDYRIKISYALCMLVMLIYSIPRNYLLFNVLDIYPLK